MPSPLIVSRNPITQIPHPSPPWSRQTDEGPRAWEAFSTYRDMGLSRSLSKVARILKKSTQLIARWSSVHSWQPRINAFDAHMEELRDRATVAGIEKARAKVAEKLELSASRTLLEVARLSYSDIRKAIKWDNDSLDFIPSDQLDEDTAAAISKISLKYDSAGRPIKTVEFHNKIAALQMAGQNLGLLKEEAQTTTINNNYLVFLDGLKKLGDKLETMEVAYNRENVEESVVVEAEVVPEKP